MSQAVINGAEYSPNSCDLIPTSHFLLKNHHAFEHTVESIVLMCSCRNECFCAHVEGNVLTHAYVAMLCGQREHVTHVNILSIALYASQRYIDKQVNRV